MPSSELTTPTTAHHGTARARRPHGLRREPGSRLTRFWRQGLPAIWTSGLMVILVLAMLGGMIALVLFQGLRHFWPHALVQVTTTDGERYLGPVRERETVVGPDGQPIERLQLWIGNRDLYGLDFKWIDVADIRERARPRDAFVLEREEHGNFHGFLRSVTLGADLTSSGDPVEDLRRGQRVARDEAARIRDLDERYESIRAPLGKLEESRQRLERRQRRGEDVAAAAAELDRRIDALASRLAPELEHLGSERAALESKLRGRVATFESVDGRTKEVPLHHIVRAYRSNAMGTPSKIGLYTAKLWEFLTAEPRESNTEGGIFPALFGTVLMVMLMTLVVVPFGVIAALYLSEYAKEGLFLRSVRLAVNNLAGVPSIVFGMFGLAFFIYGVGGSIDQLFFADRLPTPTVGTGGILWASLTLALLTLPVVVVATEEGLAAVPRAHREGSLALGATKWQTLRHVVLPQAVPGILTGIILAVGRAAGEVAPLMLTGVVKLAPNLAVDGEAPFLHLERKFMHLGFHIYDVSMQSPNVEAAKPMVYTTTLLLLVLVIVLNATAIVVRNRMRRRYRGAAV